MKTILKNEWTVSKPNPLYGWQWLQTPGVVLMLVGGLGLMRWYIREAAHYLAMLRFPPAWSCYVLLAGGAILLVLAVGAHWSARTSGQAAADKKWRTL